MKQFIHLLENIAQRKTTQFMRLISFLIFLYLFTTDITAQPHSKQRYNPDKLYSIDELKSDFNYLRNVIDQYHAGAYQYISKDSINKIFDNYYKTIREPMTERMFRNQLMAVTEIIKCGHSGIASSNARIRYYKKKPIHLIPLGLYVVDNQVYIGKNFSKDTTVNIGTIVKRIDGVHTRKIIRQLYATNSSDGFNETNRSYGYERALQFEYPKLYPTNKDTFDLTILDNNHQEKKLKIAAIIPDSLPQTPQEDTITALYANESNRFYRSDRDSSVAIFDLKEECRNGYKSFYRKGFRYIEKNKIDKLVIDLRGNGGGYLLNPGHFLGYLLPQKDYVEVWRKQQTLSQKVVKNVAFVKFTEFIFSYLPISKKISSADDTIYKIRLFFKPKKRYHFNGKVCILTDGRTFSAATYIAAYLKKYSRGIFIGQETGGAAHGCNAFIMPMVTLPNTKLRYRLPLYRVENILNTPPNGHGVMPDITTKYSIEDLLNKRDLELEKAIEMLNKK